ncbi:zinc knuckle CX2CX4HX4C containing protein [Tanacetum coccineum]
MENSSQRDDLLFGNGDKGSVKENGINENESSNKKYSNSSKELIDNENNTSIETGDDNSDKGMSCDGILNENEHEKEKSGFTPEKTYASVVKRDNQSMDTSLNFIPIVIDDDGCKFVVFDEDLVAKRSNKWKLTLYGKFVGCSMSENALRYHLRRMWSKYDFIDVQRKRKKLKFPLWARMKNIPLEAWTKNGISALESSLGKPIRMDNVTAQACQNGRGKAEFARVLVEFDVKKGLKEEIDIQYDYGNKLIYG